jgi:hypothetical protein
MSEAPNEPAPEAERPEETFASRRWTWIAAGVFALACASLLSAVWGASWSESVPVNVARVGDESRAYPRGIFDETDHRFVIWQCGRNAYTLLGAPWNLFEAEPCHPVEGALALGEPGISMGVLGALPWLMTGDPIATYNVVFLIVFVISFVAMFLLVREWTGVPAAAIVAALLFAFHEVKAKDSVHFYAWDTSWTVLALFFTSRLFARARWSDAVLLSICIGMQLAGSLYPVLCAVFIAIPVLVWLLAHHGFSSIEPPQWIFVVFVMLLVAVPIFAPYLAKTEAGDLHERTFKVFLDLRWLLPGGPAFPGWGMLGLALLAFALPRRRTLADPGLDPRWVLLIASLILISVSVGGNTAARLAAMQAGEPLPPSIPNLYDALAAVIPGMGAIRGPAALYGGVHAALAILAGFGAAGLIRRVAGKKRQALSAALIALTFIELLHPGLLGLGARIRYVDVVMRPSEAELRFFEEIAARGDEGPLLELPFNPRHIDQSSRAVLLSAYHRRRTNQCFNSFIPAEVQEVKRVVTRLPEPAAFADLSKLGFTTVVYREGDAPIAALDARDWAQVLADAEAAGLLEALGEGPGIEAWRIVPGGPAAEELRTED